MTRLNHGVSSAVLITSVTTTIVIATSYWYWKQQQQQSTTAASETFNAATTTSEIKEREEKERREEEEEVTSPPISSIDWNDGDSSENEERKKQQQQQRRILAPNTITVVHGSMTGTCLQLAKELYNDIVYTQQQQQQQSSNRSDDKQSYTNAFVQWGCIQDYDWWDELINNENEDVNGSTATAPARAMSSSSIPPILIILLPTYTSGSWTTTALPLYDALQDIQSDWRISNRPFQSTKLQVAIYGTGSSEYNDRTMGMPAKQAISSFQKLGGKIIVPYCCGDDSVGTNIQDTFHSIFKVNLFQKLFVSLISHPGNHKNGVKNNEKNSNSVKTPASTQQGMKNNKATSSSTTKEINGSNTCSTNGCSCKTLEPVDDVNHQHPQPNTNCCQQKQQRSSSSVTDNDTCCKNDNENSAAMTGMNDEKGDGNVDDVDEEYDDFDVDDDEDDDDDDEDENERGEPQVMDLEDIGDAIVASKRQQQQVDNGEPREMVTPSQAKALKKEGYKLIGTHSAVKLCRWTKHQLRGRGGCYKHTFYGITSYQCMEATPSLACANKCVFCWRHHKNPVGKEWKWKTDDPYYIVDEAVQTHIKMIKETRGIPGVQLDRWKEAHTVKHCALSLVGEPIMYPRIDELLGELHNRNISTFLVTNGQHPTAISSIRPITQLYVSVDAPTEKSLIAIDRPLFNDAWDRLRLSLSSLKDKGQRTVARLTVVKGWNSDEISGYAELIALGHVSLVEVKGVTFCGKSDASNLNMTNTPWHHEVVELTRTLQHEIDAMRVKDPTIPEYDIACEHKHSCSVLLARVDQFATEGYDSMTGQRKWRTWIDYEKFQLLAKKHTEDPSFTFGVTDYTAPTPDWAIAGSKEEGFDPTDRRHRKQTKHPKYTQFDMDGVPTHDENHQEISNNERKRLRSMMEEKKRQIGDGSTVTELRGGEKEVLDASLMFRGLVVAK